MDYELRKHYGAESFCLADDFCTFYRFPTLTSTTQTKHSLCDFLALLISLSTFLIFRLRDYDHGSFTMIVLFWIKIRLRSKHILSRRPRRPRMLGVSFHFFFNEALADHQTPAAFLWGVAHCTWLWPLGRAWGPDNEVHGPPSQHVHVTLFSPRIPLEWLYILILASFRIIVQHHKTCIGYDHQTFKQYCHNGRMYCDRVTYAPCDHNTYALLSDHTCNNCHYEACTCYACTTCMYWPSYLRARWSEYTLNGDDIRLLHAEYM